MWSVLALPLPSVLFLLAQADAGARPSFLPTPTAIAQEPRYRLKPTRDGGFEYDDSRFKAMIAPDGRVRFDDHRISGKFRVIPLVPLNHPPGTPTLESTVRDLLRRRPVAQPAREPALPERPRASGPLTEADRRRMEEYNKVIPVVATTGSFDLTDEYYRMLGEDPYRYEKAKFLSSTYEMRIKLAAESQIHDMRRSLHDLPGRLDKLWKDAVHPPAARRLIMCMLWSELYRDARGREATNVINHFVRTRLPQGSPDGFTPSELDSCNAGAEPGARFDPYKPPPPRTPPAKAPPPKKR